MERPRVNSGSRRPLTARASRPSLAIDNLDEILSLRSQASEANSVGSFIGGRHRHSSEEEEAAGGGSSSTRRRRPSIHHRANRYFQDSASVGRAVSSTSSTSIPVSVNNFLEGRRTVPPTYPSYQESFPPLDYRSEGSGTDSPRRGGLLACLGCFNPPSSPTRRRKSNLVTHQLAPAPIFSQLRLIDDPGAALIHKLLLQLSEEGEIDIDDAIDQRMIFLLFSSLTSEPLLTPEEYVECDDWCDWVILGYSGPALENFERDANRLGSQTMGLLFLLFFSIEYTDLSRMCSQIIRNVRFDPPGLFGLFAVNCSKWTRDLLAGTIVDGEKNIRKKNNPLFVEKTKKLFTKYPLYYKFITWWITNGQGGSIERAEAPYMDGGDPAAIKRPSHLYESFVDEGGEVPQPLQRRFTSGTTPGGKFHGMESRLTSIDLHEPDQVDLLHRTLLAGGVVYTYVIVSFAKFWLEQNLISADADVAREKLNNAFLEREFVSKLEIGSSPAIVRKRIKKIHERIKILWKKSGWAGDGVNLSANGVVSDDDISCD
jgi:hypothetical protein